MNWFQLGLCAMNIGASLWFLTNKNYPWALIYFGAFQIGVGSLWAVVQNAGK